MNRTYLTQYVSSQFAPLITAASATAQDTIDGYGPALDSVMRQLGLSVSADDPNPTMLAGTESDALLLTRYYALEWLLQALAAQVDYRTGGDMSKNASQLFKQVSALLTQARDKVPSAYSLESGDFALGRLELDFLEPWQA